jgi:hypothetical protein
MDCQNTRDHGGTELAFLQYLAITALNREGLLGISFMTAGAWVVCQKVLRMIGNRAGFWELGLCTIVVNMVPVTRLLFCNSI